VRAIIGTKISSKNKYICSWQIAEAENLLDYYFSGLGEWPEMSPLIVEGSKDENRIRYNNDIEDFYNQRGVTNYKIALEKKELEDYFSGVSFFPKKNQAYYKRYRYANDYDEYIASLSHEEVFNLYKKYSHEVKPAHDKFDNPTTFIGTAMGNFCEYVEVISALEDPIYIPGDGLGVGSYVAKVKGKKFFSSEPNEIGREAISNKLVTKRDYFKEEECLNYNSVFFW